MWRGGYGIIPAYAGNTPRTTFPPRRRWDHPRICGEHRQRNRPIHGMMGSSPHMRGTRNRDGSRTRHRGIIPAYAGNTRFFRLDLIVHGDHPRICGEHPVQNSTAFANGGSSPHMRGTQQRGLSAITKAGIIPAYAGNTTSCWNDCHTSRDHPRICGEHRRLPVGCVLWPGSSPHMRGTHGVRLRR